MTRRVTLPHDASMCDAYRWLTGSKPRKYASEPVRASRESGHGTAQTAGGQRATSPRRRNGTAVDLRASTRSHARSRRFGPYHRNEDAPARTDEPSNDHRVERRAAVVA